MNISTKIHQGMSNDEKNALIMHFVPYDQVADIANKEFEEQKKILQDLLPDSDIQHVGSTAVPGLLTKGDLDIQVRVKLDAFNSSKQILKQHFSPNRENEIWTDGFASFENYSNLDIPLGIQLTVIDSKYDEFYKVRDLFNSNPELIESYNQIKRQCEGKTYPEYQKRKRELFGVNGENPLLK